MGVDQRADRLRPERRNIAVEHEHVAAESIKSGARGADCIARPERLLLNRDLDVIEQVCRLRRRDNDDPRDAGVARSVDGSVFSSTAKPWFWLVIDTRPVSRSFTGWLAPWWPNFILKVLAPEASARIWCPRQMPKIGSPLSTSVRVAVIA